MKRLMMVLALILMSVTAHAQGTWSSVQSVTVPGMTHGVMYYQYLLLNYSGTGTKSPVLVYEHENGYGDGCYPGGNCAGLATGVAGAGGTGVNAWFNNASFQNRYCANGCIVLSPYADQTSDPSGATSNFGGYADTPGSEPNERGVIAVIQKALTTFNADPNRVYVTGDSLGGIGSQAIALDYGIGTGSQGHIVTAVAPFSGAIYRGGLNAPTNAQLAQIEGGPVQFDVNGSGDTSTSSNPALWMEPLWNDIAGAPGAGLTAPAAASAVGYNKLVFGPNLILNKTITDPVTGYPAFGAAAGGANIVPYTFTGTSWTNIGAVQNNDGSITIDGNGAPYGNSLSLAAAGNANQTTNRLVFGGQSFGGGAYFQATMKGSVPMSFWANDIETMNGITVNANVNPWPGQPAGYGDWIETDFAEFDGTASYGIAIHNWYAYCCTGTQTNTNYAKVVPIPTPDYTQYHDYGALWVPATSSTQGYLKYYIDGTLVSTATWNQYNPSLGPPPVDNGTHNSVTWPTPQTSGGNSAYSVLDTLHLAPIFGGSVSYSNGFIPAGSTTMTVGLDPVTGRNDGSLQGALFIGQLVTAEGVTGFPANEKVVAQLSGTPFGAGTYQVSIAPSVAINAQTCGGSPNACLVYNGDTTISKLQIWQASGANDIPVINGTVSAGYPGAPNGGRAGTSPVYFLLDTSLGHDVWDTYRVFPAAQPMLDLLFAQVTPGGTTPPPTGAPLPSGYLHVSGNQVLDGSGNNVRMSCSAYNTPTSNPSADMSVMRNQGFNCARVPWFDKVTCPGGTCSFTAFDGIVSAASANGMKVIFDHQSNEGTNGTSNCTNQQANGLWYDTNSVAPWNATNGTDGCGTAGTVTYPTFKANWTAFATHYSGNSTVVGFDLHNEPTTFGNPACCSTGGGGTGAFQIKNGQILDPNGSVFNAAGVNIYWNTTTMAQLCPTAACTPFLQNFPHVNFVRMVWENGYNQTGMEPYVGYLTALGIVVDIGDFNISPSQPPAAGTTLTAQTAWYSGLASTYKNNPYVWYESQNEMYGPGSTVASNEQILYNTVRAQTSTGIVFLGFPGGGNLGTVGINANIYVNGIFTGPMPASTFTPMSNIVWDLHFYAFLVNKIEGSYSTDIPTIQTVLTGSIPNAYGVSAAQTLTSADGTVPVIVGEFGNSTTGQSLDPDGAELVTATATYPSDSGYAAFAVGTYAIGVTCCNALTDGSSNLTSPYGAQVQALISANPAPVPPSGSAVGAGWGTGNGGDMKAMVEDVGAAVQSADPGVLIITEGIFNNGTLFNGTTRGSTALPITAGSIGDLSTIGTKPVTCCTGHVLYSVHDLPASVFTIAPDSGPSASTMRTTAWGYLEVTNKAPVWIGKEGADLDGTNGQLSDETAWATSLTSYMNGSLGGQGGPTFTGCQQPMGGDWWQFGYLPGQQINGTLNSDGTNKAGQQAFWGTLLYTTCSGGGSGGGGGTTVQASRVNDFANSLGINTQVQNNSAVYTNGSGMVTDLAYLGVRQVRDGTAASTTGARLTATTTLANNGIHFSIYPTTGGANPYTFVVASSLAAAKTIDALDSPAHALLDVEMFNEPINFGVTYSPCGTGGGGSAWTCVATADAAYYTAIKGDTQVGTLPTWSATDIGSETPNVGMQYLTIPTGTAATFPAGTNYANAYNIHIFPFFQTAVGLIDPSAAAPDQMQFQLSADFVTTSAHSYPGTPLATVLASSHTMTAFGLSSTTQVDARTKAVNLANGYLDAYFVDSFSNAFAYELYEEGDGYGYYTTTATPTLAATYMHNFTSAIADSGATATTFTPGTLTYSLTGMPTNAHSALMQTSNGHFKLAVWSNEHNYNLGTSTPITISPTSVTLTLTAAANVMTFDNTNGDITAPTQNLTNVTTVSFPVSDHIEVIDILPIGTCTSNCGGTGTGATAWNPADQSGMTLSGSNLIATSNAGVHQNVRSTTSQNAGNVCWEITATTITADWDAGLSNGTYSLTGLLGADGNGIGFDPLSGPQGVYYNNATLTSGTGVSTSGEKEDFCANLTAHTLWVTNATMRGNGFAWNNSTTANPATGTGGLPFAGMPCPCFITFNENQAGGVATLNAVGPLAVALPTGFSFWQAPVVTGTGRPFILTMP